jgi:hypothetical protein
MLPPLLRCLLIFLCASCLSAIAARGGEDDPAHPQRIEYFEKHIRPVLVEHCYACHASEAANVEGELLLDSRAALLAGGASGPAVVPGDPGASLLLRALKFEGLEMPPDRRLPAEVVAHFENWIATGAADPRVAAHPLPAKTSQIDWEAARSFWSLQPPQAAALPQVSLADWPATRSDAFVLEGIERHGMQPSPEADRATLARRLAFDLTGLPPEPEIVAALKSATCESATCESAAFEATVDEAAWERVVDRLLASPAVGERLARLWLDIARYAEDQAHIVGNDRSLCYPNAYRYRDWVIEAFNADLRYDDFVRQQLAADLLEGPTERDLRPLGFLGLGPKYYNRGSPEVMADEWEDRVDIVTRGLLGLTVACARCHDHKYDPVPTEDYYALAGVFASTSMFNHPLAEDIEKKDSGEAKNPEQALHIVREGKSQDLQVMIRGDVKRKGPQAPRGFLQALRDGEDSNWQLAAASGRLELAEAIVQPRNPLTARVIVNRIWGWLIGQPLVATASNFGRLGAQPSHPQLLDDLSVRFMHNGWSIKWLLREILLSRTYRQASAASAEALARDPDNVWLARMHRKRLPVEAWRDSLLARAGRLDRSIGGPSMNPQAPDSVRRTLYSEVSRLELNKMLALFDFPDPNTHAERRAQTTTALQKLFVLNSPFMLEQARGVVHAAGLPAQTGQPQEQVQRLFVTAMGRHPAPNETELLTEYFMARAAAAGLGPGHSLHSPQPSDQTTSDQTAQGRAGESRAAEPADDLEAARLIWVELAHALLASNELMFID